MHGPAVARSKTLGTLGRLIHSLGTNRYPSCQASFSQYIIRRSPACFPSDIRSSLPPPNILDHSAKNVIFQKARFRIRGVSWRQGQRQGEREERQERFAWRTFSLRLLLRRRRHPLVPAAPSPLSAITESLPALPAAWIYSPAPAAIRLWHATAYSAPSHQLRTRPRAAILRTAFVSSSASR
jgi:hypothetical protein